MFNGIRNGLITAFLLLGICFVTKPSIAQSISSKAVVFPLVFPKLSSGYGYRKEPFTKHVKHHSGVDLAAPKGSHVRAIKAGKVVFADYYAGYGKLVTIEHSDGYTSLYGHLSEILVNTGDIVKAGEVIGRVGSTGRATGPHLHFEWRKNGHPLNPLLVLPLTAKGKG